MFKYLSYSKVKRHFYLNAVWKINHSRFIVIILKIVTVSLTIRLSGEKKASESTKSFPLKFTEQSGKCLLGIMIHYKMKIHD